MIHVRVTPCMVNCLSNEDEPSLQANCYLGMNACLGQTILVSCKQRLFMGKEGIVGPEYIHVFLVKSA